MKKSTVLAALFITFMTTAWSQQADTITVELARTSKLVFTMQDRKDLEQLKHYDFEALFDDILGKLEAGDTLMEVIVDTSIVKMNESPFEDDDEWDDDDDEDEDWEDDWEDDDDDDDGDDDDHGDHGDDWVHDDGRKVWHSMNFDFGINNYLEDGSFPDYSGAQYTVRPWGSWYVGINSILHTDFGEKWFVEWGFGVSWYNFKFQDDRTLVSETEDGVTFTEDPRPFSYEKLSLIHI